MIDSNVTERFTAQLRQFNFGCFETWESSRTTLRFRIRWDYRQWSRSPTHRQGSWSESVSESIELPFTRRSAVIDAAPNVSRALHWIGWAKNGCRFHFHVCIRTLCHSLGFFIFSPFRIFALGRNSFMLFVHVRTLLYFASVVCRHKSNRRCGCCFLFRISALRTRELLPKS